MPSQGESVSWYRRTSATSGIASLCKALGGGWQIRAGKDLVKIGADLAAKGAGMIDAPLGRTPAHAKDGLLNIMASGDRATFDKVKPVLDEQGENVFYLGALGAGHTTKLINNFMGMTTVATMSQAFAVADLAGVDATLQLADRLVVEERVADHEHAALLIGEPGQGHRVARPVEGAMRLGRGLAVFLGMDVGPPPGEEEAVADLHQLGHADEARRAIDLAGQAGELVLHHVGESTQSGPEDYGHVRRPIRHRAYRPNGARHPLRDRRHTDHASVASP